MRLYDLFEKLYKRQPDAVAVVFNNRKTTYRELFNKVNALTYFLDEQVDLSSLLYLPIMPERDENLIVMLLAALKLGIPYVPIAVSTPESRVQTLLEDIGADLLLTSDKKITIQNVNTIFFDTNAYTPTIKNNSVFKNEDRGLAYVCFTSGSMGKAKGVAIEPESIFNLIHALQERFQLDSSDVILQFAAISFDVHVSEIFLWLASGAKLILTDEAKRHSPELLQEYISANQVTYASLPPLLLSMFHKKPMQSLKWIVISGEQAAENITEYWPSQCKLVNAYGPTEATVFASSGELSLNSPVNNIGLPLSGYQYFIVDKYGELASNGEVGELCISGKGLAVEYINNQQETEKRFSSLNIDNKTVRIYLTGDLVKRSENGLYYYMGRSDDQVQIRGHRVELNETNRIAVECNEIDAAITLVVGDGVLKKIVLFYVAKDKMFSEEFLRDKFKQNLPDYMHPSLILRIDKMPQLTSGKVDKNALLRLSMTREEPGSVEQKPYDNPELYKVIEFYQKVLDIDKIEHDSDFFDLGGNSLLAVQLLAKLNSKMNAGLVMRDIYEFSTPKQLYKRLKSLIAPPGIHDEQY